MGASWPRKGKVRRANSEVDDGTLDDAKTADVAFSQGADGDAK